MKRFFLTTALFFSTTSIVAQKAATTYSPNADRDYPTMALFGDTHVHSALSADAGGGGTTLMPR